MAEEGAAMIVLLWLEKLPAGTLPSLPVTQHYLLLSAQPVSPWDVKPGPGWR